MIPQSRRRRRLVGVEVAAAVATAAATPAKRLRGTGPGGPRTTDHSPANARTRRFSAGHKTRGGARACL